jgi:hypothetical protein
MPMSSNRGAQETANRGPNFQLGIQSEIDKERKALAPPADLQGQAPFVWKYNDRTFQISAPEMTGIGDEFILELRQELPQWGDDNFLDGENRALLDALYSQHPEFRDVFGVVFVEAVQRGRRDGYRTVEDVKKSAN